MSSEALMRGIREKFLRESHAFDAQDLAAMKQLQSTDTHRYQVPHELFLLGVRKYHLVFCMVGCSRRGPKMKPNGSSRLS